MPHSGTIKNTERDPNHLCLGSPKSSGNIVYGNHKEIYREICILKELTKAKFPVYLVHSRVTKQQYAMKVFEYENGHPHLYYVNEIRFAGLKHPNVVRNLFFEQDRKVSFNNKEKQISYKIMQYAPFGDLYHFLKAHRDLLDEKIIRSFFRQLISGIEYLHKNGVAHMDIKLENILVDENCVLKIADFDLAHFKDDAIIISNGTKFYRAPEIIQGRCNNPMAADIYSLGVVLFLLKTKGVFPQLEHREIEGVAFAELLSNDIGAFWEEHEKINKQNGVEFDEDFKELFTMMTRADPEERASIEQIKASKWYNGVIYDPMDLMYQMANSP